jgi:hypothetical protein
MDRKNKVAYATVSAQTVYDKMPIITELSLATAILDSRGAPGEGREFRILWKSRKV